MKDHDKTRGKSVGWNGVGGRYLILKITSWSYKMQLCKMMISKNKISGVNICGILKINFKSHRLGNHAYWIQDRGGPWSHPGEAVLAGEVAQLTWSVLRGSSFSFWAPTIWHRTELFFLWHFLKKERGWLLHTVCLISGQSNKQKWEIDFWISICQGPDFSTYILLDLKVITYRV